MSFKDKMQALRDDLDAAHHEREVFAENLKIKTSEMRADAQALLGRIRVGHEEARGRLAEARTQLRGWLGGAAQHRKEVGDDLRAGGRVFHKRAK